MNIEIIRHEKDGVLNGFSVINTSESKITLLIWDSSSRVYYNRIVYRGNTIFPARTNSTQANVFTGEGHEQECENFIEQEELIKEGVYEWHRQTLLRVFINHYDNAMMLKTYPIFSNFADMTEVEADGVYVYLNFLEDEHRQIIEGFNGRVETN